MDRERALCAAHSSAAPKCMQPACDAPSKAELRRCAKSIAAVLSIKDERFIYEADASQRARQKEVPLIMREHDVAFILIDCGFP